MESPTDERRSLETTTVWNNRYREARAGGLEHMDAIRFARSDTDIAELRKLVRSGCPPELVRAIVL